MVNYVHIEFFALLTFVGRFLYYITRPHLKFDYKNWMEFPVYIGLIFLNGILYYCLTDKINMLEPYNIVIPNVLLMSLIFKRRVKLLVLLGLMFLIPGIFYFLNLHVLNLLNYNLAIVLMMRNAVKMSSNSSRNLKRAFLYIIFSIDLLFTLTSYELGFLKQEWNQIKLIHCYSILSLVIFATTIIFSHLFLVKFFTRKTLSKLQ